MQLLCELIVHEYRSDVHEFRVVHACVSVVSLKTISMCRFIVYTDNTMQFVMTFDTSLLSVVTRV